MKSYHILCLLSILSMGTFIIGMDRMIETVKKDPQTVSKVDQHLNFTLNKRKEIVEYGCSNMEFFCPPKDFLNKKILDVVPLSEADQKAIKAGFRSARKNREEQKVAYALADAKFCAAIKYLSKNEQYRVKVTKQ